MKDSPWTSHSHELGSLAWARPRAGQLGRGERLREGLRGVRALLEERSARFARRLGFRPRALRLALAEVPVPRSALAQLAEQALADAPPWLVAHSMRSYFWGSLLGRRDDLAFDPELFFVAALLHDLGLVERSGEACFALRGAEQASRLLAAGGAGAGFVERVADAICLHLNVRPSESTVEARLLRAGSGFDVVADRFEHLDPSLRREVVTAWPREGFAPALIEVMRGEARAHPATRIGFLCHHLRFVPLIREADARFERDWRSRGGQ